MPRLGVSRRCECGAEFHPFRQTQRFCSPHCYGRSRTGTTLGRPISKRLQLLVTLSDAALLVIQGAAILISTEDVEMVRTRSWYVNRHGYAATAYGRLLHRVVMGEPRGRLVDHINGDKLDNRRTNLRIATFRTNARNRHTEPRGATGVRGVSRVTSAPNRYRAHINVDDRQIFLGHYSTIGEAAEARAAAEVELWGTER